MLPDKVTKIKFPKKNLFDKAVKLKQDNMFQLNLMTRFIIVFLAIISSIPIYAQEYNTTIGLKFFAGKATIISPIPRIKIGSRFSISEGIEVRQRIIEDFVFLETGIFIFNRGMKNKHEGYDVSGNSTGILVGIESHNYLLVPLSVIFKFKKFYVGAGMNLNSFLSRKFIGDDILISREKLDFQEGIIFGSQIFGGYEVALNDKLLAGFEVFANGTVYPRYLNYGLGLSLKYIVK